MITVYQVEYDSRGQIVERRLLDANQAFLRSAGAASIEQLRGKTASEVFGKEWADFHLPAVRQAMASGTVQVQEVHRSDSGGSYLTTIPRWMRGPTWARAATSPRSSGPRQRSGRRSPRRTALADKDALLREAHHRVKNNLQMLCDLMYRRWKRSDSSPPAAATNRSASSSRASGLMTFDP